MDFYAKKNEIAKFPKKKLQSLFKKFKIQDEEFAIPDDKLWLLTITMHDSENLREAKIPVQRELQNPCKARILAQRKFGQSPNFQKATMPTNLKTVAEAAGIDPDQFQSKLLEELKTFWLFANNYKYGKEALTQVCKAIALLNWNKRIAPDIGNQFRGVVSSVLDWYVDQNVIKKATFTKTIKFFFYDRGKFACHVSGSLSAQIKEAIGLITSCLLNIETVYTEFLELATDQRADFLRNYITQYEDIKKFRPCIEGSCEAFTDALTLTKHEVEPFKFDSSLNKYQNLGNAGNYFRKITCKKCVGWDNVPYCFSFEFKYLPAFLLDKVGDKKAKDGIITKEDIQQFIEKLAEDLYDCTGVLKDVELDVGDYPPFIDYRWTLPTAIEKQMQVLGKQ